MIQVTPQAQCSQLHQRRTFYCLPRTAYDKDYIVREGVLYKLNTLKWEQRWVAVLPTAVHVYRMKPAHGTKPEQVMPLGMDAVVEVLAPQQVN